MTLVERLNKSILIRTHRGITQLRGAATRALMFAVLKGGRHLVVGRNVAFEIYGTLKLGDRVTLADGCALEVGPNGHLVIGDDVFIGRHSVVRAHESIELGDRCTIAEHCTIRDQNHMVDPERRLRETHATSNPVRLERNVWIGAGVRVLMGSHIGEGSVVAANAVVRGDFPAAVVIGGVPARILRSANERKPGEESSG
jgi:serine acetyltransferase